MPNQNSFPSRGGLLGVKSGFVAVANITSAGAVDFSSFGPGAINFTGAKFRHVVVQNRHASETVEIRIGGLTLGRTLYTQGATTEYGNFYTDAGMNIQGTTPDVLIEVHWDKNN